MARATELVVVENFQALTTSLKIAEAFEKDHAHVMRDIHTLIQQMASNQEKPILDSAQMFQESSYRVEGQLRKYPMFLINRDGFSLLAMGFTGAKALQFKLKFIQAFNAMEQKLTELTAAELERQELRRQKIRAAGKPKRRGLTDAIKVFVDKERPKNPGLYYAVPTKRIQTELCGIPKGGRDNATGAELLKLATLEVAGANAFNRADGQGKGFWAAYPDVNQVVTILASVYDGEVPMLGQKNKAFLDALKNSDLEPHRV